jgi:quercetin dioxygenase-like cupin family protein
MKTEVPGITRANEGMQGISWNILGQTYVPKHVTEHSFSWHATFPPDTFVPPHIHPDQDEYLYILEGKLDFMLGVADAKTVRPVLEHPQHEGTEAGRRRGARRRTQHPLPAAAGGVKC